MNAKPSPSNGGTYVYCISKVESFGNGAPSIAARPIGGGPKPVYAIPFMDIAALVSECAATRYDVGRENTMAHQLVIEEVMARGAVLPVCFSTVAKNDDEVLEKLLKRKYGELRYLLDNMEGRVELGLKVFWQRGRIFADIVDENTRIRTLRNEMAVRTPEETHYQRIQLGQLTEEAINRKRDEEAEGIVALLRPLAVETKVNKILTDMMVLNAAFLVRKADEPAFDNRVNEIEQQHAGRLILKYVGPVPPYNFVNVVVRWQDD